MLIITATEKSILQSISQPSESQKPDASVYTVLAFFFFFHQKQTWMLILISMLLLERFSQITFGADIVLVVAEKPIKKACPI